MTFDRVNSLMEDVYPAKLTANDRFLFYFSGHGDTRDLYGGKRGYLVLKARASAALESDDRHAARACSGAPISSRARQSLFFLDACFSGLGVGSRSVVAR